MTNGKLIVFTRYPESGRTKTRLVSTLGAQGAADLHRQMAERAVRTARAAMAGKNVDVEICFTGGDEQKMREWLGADLRYSLQVGHDLGQRMANAFQLGFHEGYRRVVLIGTDCPELTGNILDKAFALLEQRDVVIGPAHDGGYYLIGMARACLRAFTAIPWGTAKVLQATLDALRDAGTSWALVDRLVDVDTAEDLVVWEKVAEATRNGGVSVSVVIPTLNEASCIAEAIHYVKQEHPLEVIVADGGSADGTADIAWQTADRVIPCPRGRAWQMNAGAAAATGDVLLFLHADTHLPPNALAKIASVMSNGKYIGGAFDLSIDSNRLFLRYIGARASLRSRISRIPYGDQAIFIDREYFESIGRFAQIPIMEDVDLMRRIKKDGKKIHIFRDKVMTSARRWEAEGPLYATIRNRILLLLYYLGVSPKKLVRLYRTHSDPPGQLKP
jgi:rSAM/selenodomain-associated transferase 2/rSAM/selenodomain-associated transferase 1